MKVNQLMKRSVHPCAVNDSLNDAARVMWENDCGCAPVTDSEGRVVAMLTDRDVCMAAYFQNGPLSALRVSSAMSQQVFTCGEDDSIATAEATMREQRVRRLPVVDAEGHLVGILSLNDIAAEASQRAKGKKREVTLAEVGSTLASICVPHQSHALATA